MASSDGFKSPAAVFQSSEHVKALRKGLGMTQTTFWAPLGITQSGGSRYESGRGIPEPVQILLQLTYGTDKQCETLLAHLRQRDA